MRRKSSGIVTFILAGLFAAAFLLLLLQSEDEQGEIFPVPTERLTIVAEDPTGTPTSSNTPSASPTSEPTTTPTHSPEPSETASSTPRPSDTPLPPTSSPRPTLTPSATPPCETIIVSGVGAFVRNGPGTQYATVGTVEQNATFVVVGYLLSEDGNTWFNITLGTGERAWISSAVADLETDGICNEISLAPTVPATPIPPTRTRLPSTPHCGDSICQANEDFNSCSLDCPISSAPNNPISLPPTPLRPENRPTADGPTETPERTRLDTSSNIPITSSNNSGENNTGHNNSGNQGVGLPFSCDFVVDIIRQDCDALVALYNGAGGSNWTRNQGWQTNNRPCSWYGISCQGNRIFAIYLDSNNLNGALQPSLANLTGLRLLYLNNNPGLSGDVSTFQNLTQLLVACVTRTGITGELSPDISCTL